MNYTGKSNLASNLKKLRKQCGLTQLAVADALGIERSRYAHYENNTSPSTDNLKRLAAIFNVSVDELLIAPQTTEFCSEIDSNDLWESFMLSELKSDEKSLVIKYRLLSPEGKMEMLKEIEDKLQKSEN